MSLGGRIAELRRQKGWSQENLAEQLGVTRQSVSKWESDASVPDLDKIVSLSDLFGVSTDYLIKDDEPEAAATAAEPQAEQSAHYVSASQAQEFIAMTENSAPKTALAVMLCILSPVCLIFLAALSDVQQAPISEGAATGIGMAALLILVAVGVAALIITSGKLSKYEFLDKELIRLDAAAERSVRNMKADFQGSYYRSVAIGVTLCILGVLPLIVLSCMGARDIVVASGVDLLLICVAIAVYLFVRFGCIWSAYNKLLQLDDYTPENKAVERRTSVFSGAYWCLMTAIYLAASFVTGRWDRTWIIWPVAGVLFAAVRGIVDSVIKGKK